MGHKMAPLIQRIGGAVFCRIQINGTYFVKNIKFSSIF